MGEHSSYTGDLLSRVPTLRLYQARFVNDIPTPFLLSQETLILQIRTTNSQIMDFPGAMWYFKEIGRQTDR